jgi:hypothetical protein
VPFNDASVGGYEAVEYYAVPHTGTGYVTVTLSGEVTLVDGSVCTIGYPSDAVTVT